MKYDRDKEWTRPDWVQRASTLAEQVSAACDYTAAALAYKILTYALSGTGPRFPGN